MTTLAKTILRLSVFSVFCAGVSSQVLAAPVKTFELTMRGHARILGDLRSQPDDSFFILNADVLTMVSESSSVSMKIRKVTGELDSSKAAVNSFGAVLAAPDIRDQFAMMIFLYSAAGELTGQWSSQTFGNRCVLASREVSAHHTYGEPKVSPDGRLVAFTERCISYQSAISRTLESNLLVVEMGTGQVQRRISGVRQFHWLPDQSLLVSNSPAESSAIRSTGWCADLFSPGDEFVVWREFPDGRQQALWKTLRFFDHCSWEKTQWLDLYPDDSGGGFLLLHRRGRQSLLTHFDLNGQTLQGPVLIDNAEVKLEQPTVFHLGSDGKLYGYLLESNAEMKSMVVDTSIQHFGEVVRKTSEAPTAYKDSLLFQDAWFFFFRDEYLYPQKRRLTMWNSSGENIYEWAPTQSQPEEFKAVLIRTGYVGTWEESKIQTVMTFWKLGTN